MIRAASWGTAALFCLAGVVAVIVTTPAQASASTAYRYWAFFTAHGSTWQYAQRGPASEYPADGDVEGWRFAIQTDAAAGLAPRDVPDFAALCASSPAKPGELRVGIVIDFGVAADAPAHESPPGSVVPGCVYVHDGASGAAVLQAATTVRIGTGSFAGLVCGIDGYPKSECAPAVAATQTGTETPTARPTPAPIAHPTQSSAPPPAPTSAATTPAAVVASSLSPADSAPPVVGGTSPSGIGAPSAAAATSLSLLRVRSKGSDRIEFTAVLGGVLVIVIGGAAIWRARSGRP